jgi:hypothetical protein
MQIAPVTSEASETFCFCLKIYHVNIFFCRTRPLLVDQTSHPFFFGFVKLDASHCGQGPIQISRFSSAIASR